MGRGFDPPPPRNQIIFWGGGGGLADSKILNPIKIFKSFEKVRRDQLIWKRMNGFHEIWIRINQVRKNLREA